MVFTNSGNEVPADSLIIFTGRIILYQTFILNTQISAGWKYWEYSKVSILDDQNQQTILCHGMEESLAHGRCP